MPQNKQEEIINIHMKLCLEAINERQMAVLGGKKGKINLNFKWYYFSDKWPEKVFFITFL